MTTPEKTWFEEPFICFASIVPKPIDWLWTGYLAKGKFTTLSGEPGHGKSLVSLDIAARLTTGRVWPDGQTNLNKPAGVLLLTEEEDAADTIMPRFLSCGGNPAKFHTMNMLTKLFQVEKDCQKLATKLISELPDIKLIILDPVSDYTRVDPFKDTEVRPMLNQLVRVASQLNIVILGINHLNKKTDMSAMHRVAGAKAWISVSRLNFILGKSKDGLKTRHICPLKVNVAPDDHGSLDYEIETVNLKDWPELGKQPQIKWLGTGTVTADEITMSRSQPKSPTKSTRQVEEWLTQSLPDGEWYNTQDIMNAGLEMGFTEDKIRRASAKLGVEKRKIGMPAIGEWRLKPTVIN